MFRIKQNKSTSVPLSIAIQVVDKSISTNECYEFNKYSTFLCHICSQKNKYWMFPKVFIKKDENIYQ